MIVHIKEEVIYQQYTATMGLGFYWGWSFKVVGTFLLYCCWREFNRPTADSKAFVFLLVFGYFCALDCSFPAAGESPPLLPCFAEDEGKLCCTFSKLALATDFISTFGSADAALLYGLLGIPGMVITQFIPSSLFHSFSCLRTKQNSCSTMN